MRKTCWSALIKENITVGPLRELGSFAKVWYIEHTGYGKFQCLIADAVRRRRGTQGITAYGSI